MIRATTPVYALLDEETLVRHGWSTPRFIERAEALGAPLLQYRNKHDSIGTIKKRLQKISALFRGRLIVNDHPELAYLCDGVHVGQDDLKRYGHTPEEALLTIRAMVGEAGWIGLSTHNAGEIETANNLPLNYIGLGALRATSTKHDANVLGAENLARLAALSKHPVAMIGGVRPDDSIPNVHWNVIGSALYED